MRPAFALIAALALLEHAFGQIVTETAQTPEFYVQNVLLGAGIECGNIRHVGMIGGLGQFDAPVKIIGVKSGLILTTGNADSIGRPNTDNAYTSTGKLPAEHGGWAKRGDKDLNKIAHGGTRDITVIEFDFVPVNNVLEFNYVFASDEYPEYASSPYNDVFGFFLSGPGVKRKTNLAVLPDGKTTIAVNHVNAKKNKQYYRDNRKRTRLMRTLFVGKAKRAEIEELKQRLQFDGLTTVLKVHCDVIPYKKYHLKIAIGDVGDWAYDSGVFLEAGSFTSVADTSGKYYEKLEQYVAVAPDIDSILGVREVPVAVVSPVEEAAAFDLTAVYFGVNSFQLNDSAQVQLDLFAAYLSKNPKLAFTLYGYTDNTGSAKHNQRLSEQRAKSVMNYLERKGVSVSRMNYTGYGIAHPRSDNSTEEARSQNRRVEIQLEE